MSLTMDEALNADRFHYDVAGCTNPAKAITWGARTGRPYYRVDTWRRNGRTKTWATRPGVFRIPVKYGLRAFGRIAEYDMVHTEDACPTLLAVAAWEEAHR